VQAQVGRWWWMQRACDGLRRLAGENLLDEPVQYAEELVQSGGVKFTVNEHLWWHGLSPRYR